MAPGTKVGTGYVSVEGDFAPFERQLEAYKARFAAQFKGLGGSATSGIAPVLADIGKDAKAAAGDVDGLRSSVKGLGTETDKARKPIQGTGGDLGLLETRLKATRAAIADARTSVGGFGGDLKGVRAALNDARAGISPFSGELGKAREALRAVGGDTDLLSTHMTQAQRVLADATGQLDKTGSVSRSTQGALQNLGARGAAGVEKDFDKMRATVASAESEIDKTGTLSRRTQRDLENLGGGAGGAGGGIGGLVSSLDGANAGLGGFGATVAIGVPVLIAFSGAAVAVASALAPLVGLAGAAAVGVTAAAQGFGVFRLATSGISAALREQTTNQTQVAKSAITSGSQQRAAAQAIQSAMDGVRTAHEQVTSATERLGDADHQVVTAEQGVATAQLAARTAQTALTQARTDARRALTDMQTSLASAVTSERGAVLGLKDAQAALAALLAGPGFEDLAKAHEDITSAINTEQRSTWNLRDAQDALAALQAGPSQDALARAHETVTSAIHAQESAVLNLQDATEAYNALIAGPSAEDVGKGQLDVSEAQTGQQQATLDLAAAQRTYNDTLADSSSTETERAQAAIDLRNAQDGLAEANYRVTDSTAALQRLQAGPSDEDRAKAVLAIGDAQDGVASATDSVTDAQTALNALQTPASQEDLAKATLDVSDAQVALAGSIFSVADAQRALTRLASGPSQEDVAKATLAVVEAQNTLTTSTIDLGRQRRDTNRALADGVSGAPAVVAAQHDLTTAHRSVTDALYAVTQAQGGVADAHRALADAERGVTTATNAVHNAQLNAASSADGASASSKNLNRAMDALSPPAKAFVRELISLKPRLDDLRATAAAGFFPGAAEGLRDAAKNFGPVRTVVAATARVLGTLSERAGELVGSRAFGKDIETVGRRNARIIGTLGDGVLHLVDAFRNIVVTAGPLTTWLARVADGWAKQIDSATKLGRENGRLAGFFERTRAVLVVLGDTVKHLSGGLLGVGKVGSRSGNDILRSVDAAARRFDQWTSSKAGRRSLTDFFENSRRLVADLGPAISGIAKALATVGFGPFATALKLAGPHAQELTYIFLGWKIVGTIIRGITIATKAWEFAQAALNIVMDANPIGLVVAAIAALGIGLYEAYKHVKPFRDAVDATFKWIKDNWPLLAGILTLGLSTAITWVVEHFSQIKDTIVGVFNDVVTAATNLPGNIIGAIKAIPQALIDAGSWILGQIVAGFEAVTRLFAGIGTWLLDTVVGLVKAVPDALIGVGSWVLDTIVGGFKAVTRLFGSIGKWYFDTLVGFVKVYLDAWKSVGSWVLDRIIDGFKAVTGLFSTVGTWLKDRFVSLVHGAIDGLKDLGSWVLNRIVDGFKVVTTLLGGAGGWLKDRFLEFVHNEVAGLNQLGSWLLNRIVDGFKTVTDLLGGVGGWIKDRIVSLIKATVGDLTDIGKWVLGTIVSGIEFVTRRGVSGLDSVGDWIHDTLKKLLDGIADKFRGVGKSVIGWIVDGLKGGAIKVQDFLNDIIHIINKGLGFAGVNIPDINVVKRATGGTIGGASAVEGYASGGEVRRGTKITSPMIMMGEEAPSHPEWVIPTNPAYRDRARMLLGHAARAIGYATGGVLGTFEATAYGPPWDSMEGSGITSTGIRLAGAPTGLPGPYIVAVDPSVIPYHSQLLIQPNPFGYLGTFAAEDTGGAITDHHIDFLDMEGRAHQNAWGRRDVQVSLAQHASSGGGGGGGILDTIGGALGSVGGALGDAAGTIVDAAGHVVRIPAELLSQGAKWILDKLPNPADLLPDWLQGLGKYAISHATDWIKHKVESIVGLGGGGSDPSGGASGTHVMDGHPVADWIYSILAQARQAGVQFAVSSGFRTDAEQTRIYDSGVRPAAVPRSEGGPGSNHEGAKYPLGAVDISPGAASLSSWLEGSRYASTLIYAGAKDPVHFSHPHGGGYAMGGILGQLGGALGGLPFGGSFDEGGVVPGPVGRPTMILAHGGETVVPRAAGLELREPQELNVDVRVYMDGREITDRVDVALDKRDRRTAGVGRGGVGR